MTDRELMQMALEYLIEFGMGEMPTAKALRDRLAWPEHVHAIDISQERVDETAKRKHEPVAWLSKCYSDDNEDLSYNLWDIDVGEGCFPVYRAPKQWVGFTHEELAWLNEALNLGGRLAVIEAIEDKLKRKNHGVD